MNKVVRNVLYLLTVFFGSQMAASQEELKVLIVSDVSVHIGKADSFFSVIDNSYKRRYKLIKNSKDTMIVESRVVRFSLVKDLYSNNVIGEWRTEDNDMLIQSGTFDSNGVANGKFLSINGFDTSLCYFKDGFKTGIQIYRNNNFRISSSYFNGKKHGIEVHYLNNNCQKISNYCLGQLNGVTIVYRYDEIFGIYVYKKFFYKNGVLKNGLYYSYNPNGSLLSRRRYYNGKLIGRISVYDENGIFIKKLKEIDAKHY